MPPKKEVKAEEPFFVDEDGSYVHEAEQAKYRGGVRRYSLGGFGDGSGAAPNGGAGGGGGNSGGGAAGNAGKSPSPPLSGKGGGAAANSLTLPPAAGAGGAAAAAGTATGGGATSAAGTSGTAPGGGSAAPGADGLPLYRHGRGVYSCPTFVYDGDWEEDAMHGHGTLTFTQSGNTYVGAFSRGCFAGEGTYTWRDGAVYVGQWRANRMHGLGVYTDAQGHLWRGRYFNGTGPGLIRLYPTLEPAEGVAVATGTATPSIGATAHHTAA